MTRTLAVLGVGVWLGLLVASWMIASISFKTASTLAGPGSRRELQERLSTLPDDARVQVFRHFASEVNRAMFGQWILAQIVVGGLTLALAARGGGPWGLATAALVVVFVQAGLYVRLLEVGRSIDFVARPLARDVAAQFGLLHGAYGVLDLAKLGLLVWLVARLLRMAR